MRLEYNECAAEIIKDHNALTYTLKPRDLEEAADMACQLKIADMNTVFPDVSGTWFWYRIASACTCNTCSSGAAKTIPECLKSVFPDVSGNVLIHLATPYDLSALR